jgi:hypothetical protein
VKGNVVPLQARCGPEGSRRFRLPDFHDIRHMKMMRSSASRTGRIYPQEIKVVLIFTRGWVDHRAMVRSEGNMSLKNPVTPTGIDPGTVRLVAQRLNHYATSGPSIYIVFFHISSSLLHFAALRGCIIKIRYQCVSVVNKASDCAVRSCNNAQFQPFFTERRDLITRDL